LTHRGTTTSAAATGKCYQRKSIT